MVKQPMITTISNPWNFIQEQRWTFHLRLIY
jgi:hypothetical protein